MRIFVKLLFISPLILASGCAHHTRITDYVPDYSTHEIILKARCEAQPVIAKYYNERLKPIATQEAPSTGAGSRNDNSGKIVDDLVKIYDEQAADKLLKDNIKNNRKKLIRNTLLENYWRQRLSTADPRIPDQFHRITSQITKITKEKASLIREAEFLKAQLVSLEKKRAKAEKEVRKKAEDKKSQQKLKKFEDTILAFKFSFDLTRNDDATGSGSITWPINSGTLTLGFDAGDKQEVKAKRVVDIVLKFIDIMSDKVNCHKVNSQVTDKHNGRYPITGAIGIDKLVHQYLLISELSAIKTGEKAFTETLTFTTTANGGLSPSINIAPATKHVIKASGNFVKKRTDIHEVVVGIYHDAGKSGGGAKSTEEEPKEVHIRKLKDDEKLLPSE